MSFDTFDSIRITGMYVFVTLLMLVSIEIGYWIGARIRARINQDFPVSMGTIVGGLLGMLGFVLAMTFSMAASQHDHRKQNVLDEANTIGTAYLRADLIDKQSGAEVKRLLREYVDIRLAAADGKDLAAAMTRSVEIHDVLWAQVSAAAEANASATSFL